MTNTKTNAPCEVPVQPGEKVKKTDWGKVRRHALEVLGIVSDVSSVLIHLKSKPKPSDWLAIGLKGMNVGFRVHEYYQRQMNHDSNEFFCAPQPNDDQWLQIGDMYWKYLADYVTDSQRIIGYGTDESPVQIGKLGGSVEVGYVGKKPSVLSRYYVKRSNYQDFLDKLCELFWLEVGTNFVHYTKSISPDEFDVQDCLVTPKIESLYGRVDKFLKKGQHRSYLIEGVPGSGKSTAVKIVTKKLGLRTVRLDFTSLNQNNYAGIRGVLACIRPDVIIIDDMDRAADNNIPIPLVEEWRERVKIIFVTVNHMTHMADAMLRPGRLDDHIQINNTDAVTVTKMLDGEDMDLVDRLSSWPIAYVADFVRRRDVFGSAQARAELENLDPLRRMLKVAEVNNGKDVKGPGSWVPLQLN